MKLGRPSPDRNPTRKAEILRARVDSRSILRGFAAHPTRSELRRSERWALLSLFFPVNICLPSLPHRIRTDAREKERGSLRARDCVRFLYIGRLGSSQQSCSSTLRTRGGSVPSKTADHHRTARNCVDPPFIRRSRSLYTPGIVKGKDLNYMASEIDDNEFTRTTKQKCVERNGRGKEKAPNRQFTCSRVKWFLASISPYPPQVGRA